MLFTDGPVITQADLVRLESEIPDVATTEQIDLDDHIVNCTEEFAEWLMLKMQAFSGYLPPFNVPLTPAIALTSLITQASNRGQISLTQVMVTSPEYPAMTSQLKRLLMYETVAKFYRQASRRKDKDRFEEKWRDYNAEVEDRYRPRFKGAGCPIVYKPFPRPGAELEPGAGIWSETNVTVLSGTPGTGSDPSYNVCVTWVDASVYRSAAVPNQGESGPSEPESIQVAGADQIVVSIAGLVAPDGTFRPSSLANVPVTPLNATGWNIYAGAASQPMRLQTPSPVPYGTKTFTLPITLDTSTAQAGFGQHADLVIPIQDRFSRA